MRIKSGRLGWGVILLPLTLVALMIIAVVVDDDSAAADGIQGVICAPLGSNGNQIGPYGPEQMANARAIVAVGKQLAVPEQGLVIALMAAMTESGLRNVDHGDRDSLGRFQMRPSQGWGTPEQITDSGYAARTFFDRLLNLPDWQQLSPTAAAQAIERSAFPDRYTKYEQHARQVLGAVQGVTCSTRGEQQVSLPDNPRAQAVINAALGQLGVHYAWGGGTTTGPSIGTGVDAGIVGFDCSGLVLFSYAQIGVAVPHQTQAIWAAFQPAITNQADIQPGDLILLSSNGSATGIHHVAIYLGNAQAVHAPHSGDIVRVVDQIWASSYWSKEFIGAVRPGVDSHA